MSKDRKYLRAKMVRERFGWSRMTLWRRMNEEGSSFPRPIKISGQNYWLESELVAYDEKLKADRDAA